MTLSEEYKNLSQETLSNFENLVSEWDGLTKEQQKARFLSLNRVVAEELFLNVSAADQADLILLIPRQARKSWVRIMAPDDLADLLQKLPDEEVQPTLELLDAPTKVEVRALLAYQEDQAGGLMNSRFARLRPDMKVEEAIRYLRAQTHEQVETVYYAYILDRNQKLLGAVSLRELFVYSFQEKISNIMTPIEKLAVVKEEQDQEKVAQLFSKKNLLAIPVVDDEGIMKGLVTIDDIIQVTKDEATEDIQKIGGMEAMEAPYFKIGFLNMIRKRAGWLLVLFIGEMFTATAMGHYEDEISKAVVLALFIPLIISSGGNSGSQASTLIIRSLALDEIRLKDWWRVLFKELFSGLTLGIILGLVGLSRVFLWPGKQSLYGEHWQLIGLTVGISLVGIVLWGTLTGSMLPFIFKRLKFDPAVASAPFVATLVDVTGIVIYFSVASLILGGLLL